MKFRCEINDYDQINNFLRVLQTFCRFSHSFYVRLSETEMQLITDQTQNSSSFVVKCDLNRGDYFNEYHFRGINSDNNLIYFQMRSDSCLTVLSSLTLIIKSLRLKLTNVPTVGQVLAVTVEYPAHNTDRYVTHQIKVDILRAEHWNSVYDYHIGDFDISMYLPDGRAITATTERLANFNHYIKIKANRVDPTKSVLKISIKTDSIKIENKFSKLDLNLNEDSQTFTPKDSVAVRVDVRKINILFNTLKQLKPNTIICNISDKTSIYLQFFYNFANFQAFIANTDS